MHADILSVPMDGIVGSAGAYVELDGKMIYHRPMTEEMNRQLLEYFESRGIAILLETNTDTVPFMHSDFRQFSTAAGQINGTVHNCKFILQISPNILSKGSNL